MSTRVTFDGAPPAGTINLGLGQPSADLLPVDLLRQASDAFFKSAQPIELNYGVMQGDERFLASLAGMLSSGYGATVSPESLFVSGGNSQALDFISMVFTRPGDTIFVEEPSYFLAFQIFRDHGLKIVGIPVDDNGLDLDALTAALKSHRPRMLYTIPGFHNPGGHCLSAQRRARLVELSVAHDFIIAADEVYQLLWYYDPPPPAFGTLIDSGTVLSMGSFSKILAPAMRLGWIQGAPGLLDKMLASGLHNSGGCVNHYSSHIVRTFIDLGLQSAHLDVLRRTLRSRCEAMGTALDEHFGDLARWTRPEGGYFYWLTFDESVDTSSLKKPAAALETGLAPGALFSSYGGLRNCLRLCFAHYDERDIAMGVARLRKLFA